MVRIIKNNFKNPLVILLIFAMVVGWVFSGWPQIWQKSLLTFETKPVKASPGTIENLWSGSNSVSSAGLALSSSENADGSTTGTWADANGKWAKATYEWWEFVMQDSSGSGTINSVTLYLKHYQSGWDNDSFKIQIFDGSTYLDVRTYSSGDGPPTGDTTDNWDVKTLGIDSWTKIDAAKVRIIGNGQSAAEDTVDWFVDTVELTIDYTAPVVSLSISPTSTDYGSMDVSEVKKADTVNADNEFIVTNTGNVAEDFDIISSDATGDSGWTLSTTSVGSSIFMHAYSTLKTLEATTSLGSTGEQDTKWVALDKDPNYKTLATNVPATSGTADLVLELLTPSEMGDYVQKSITVTVRATEY